MRTIRRRILLIQISALSAAKGKSVRQPFVREPSTRKPACPGWATTRDERAATLMGEIMGMG